MQWLPVAGFTAGAGIAALGMGRALSDDYHLRLRNTDAREYQHVMVASNLIAATEFAAVLTMAVSHARGASGVTSAAAGAALGLGVGMLGSVVATRFSRNPDGHVPQEWML